MTSKERMHLAHVAYMRALGVAQNVKAALAAYDAVMAAEEAS